MIKESPNLDSDVRQDDTFRTGLFLSFLLFTGLMIPIWWWTTTVPREKLIFHSFEDKLWIKSIFKVYLVNFDDDQWKGLDDSNLDIYPLKKKGNKVEHQVTVEIKTLNLQISSLSLNDLLNVTSKTSRPSSPSIYEIFLFEECDSVKPVISMSSKGKFLVAGGLKGSKLFSKPQELLENLFGQVLDKFYDSQEKISLIKDSDNYQLTFTLVVGQDVDSRIVRKIDWDPEMVAKKSIVSVVEGLKTIADFDINFQLRPFVEYNSEFEFDGNGNFIIPKDQLPSFVEDNKWNFLGTISQATSINFVIFIPPTKQQPLKIDKSSNPYFGYKKWGGVYILNTQKDFIDETLLMEPFLFFSSHLKTLFISEEARSEYEFEWHDDRLKESGMITSLNNTQLRNRIILQRFSECLNILKSLESLLRNNSEIVVLPSIRSLVNRANFLLSNSIKLLGNGDLDSSLLLVSEALQKSKEAFYHPSMMAHQYFPQEHKLGIYMPLFFPFILPIAFALLRASLKYFKELIMSRKALKNKDL